MKPFFEYANEEDFRFDRLVDGELTDEERRELLAGLDDEPGGWRRCAIAFLEAQAWQQSMQCVQEEGLDLPNSAPRPELDSANPSLALSTTSNGQTKNQVEPTPDRIGWVGLALAMAACFLVAFFLGTEFRQRWAASPPTMVQGDSPRETSEISEEVSVPVSDDLDRHPMTPWGEATFVVNGREDQELDVPIFDLDRDARQVLVDTSTAAFNNLSRELQLSGFEVQRSVDWTPVEMGDGQQMFVPIGNFEIAPISHQSIP